MPMTESASHLADPAHHSHPDGHRTGPFCMPDGGCRGTSEGIRFNVFQLCLMRYSLDLRRAYSIVQLTCKYHIKTVSATGPFHGTDHSRRKERACARRCPTCAQADVYETLSHCYVCIFVSGRRHASLLCYTAKRNCPAGRYCQCTDLIHYQRRPGLQHRLDIYIFSR
jgi:hypothetical protein